MELYGYKGYDEKMMEIYGCNILSCYMDITDRWSEGEYMNIMDIIEL